MALAKWKRLTVVAAAVALIASGCSGNGGSQTGPAASAEGTSSTAPAGETVKLKYWGAIPPENGPQKVVDAWNAQNPNIQVEYYRYVNDEPGNTKLDTALISKNDAPDIFVSYGETHLNRRLNAGMAEPLGELIAQAKFDVDTVIGKDNIIEVKGQIMYLPAIRLLTAVLFNENALKEAGLTLPKDWTLEEFADTAAKLTTPQRKGVFMGVTSDNLARFSLLGSKPVDSYYKEDGTSNFDSASLRRGLELQKQLTDGKSMVPWPEVIASKLLPQNELLSNKAAMVMGGTHNIRDLKNTADFPRDFKVLFAPNPQAVPGGNINYAGFNDFMSINKNSKYKKEAMQFIAWYLTKGNEDMIPGGRLPSNKNADIDKVVELFVGEYGAQIDKPSLAEVLKKEYSFPKQLRTEAYSDLSKVLLDETERYVMGVQTLDQTMQQLKSKADKAIAEVK
ncbi:MAG: hypothetical protein K0R57_2680 [Paenibacillaceae bacterium]|jgi:multiple sugar transport system substrate-binding protein|nr:hypothetical protein [Paenibacillaceae bacterium]